MADPGGFISFHGNPFSKVLKYLATFIHCLILVVRNILCTVVQPFLIN